MTAQLHSEIDVDRIRCPWDSITLVDVVAKQAFGQPLNEAFVFVTNGDQVVSTLTFGSLAELATDAARRLCGLADPGDRVLLLYDTGPEFAILFFACLSSGVIPVPINPPRSESTWSRTASIIRDCKPRFGFASSLISESLLKHPRCGEETSSLNWYSLDELQAQDINSPQSLRRLSPDDLAFLQYTSGSTAIPRGVRISHRNVMHNLAAIKESFGHDTETINVSWLPIFHDMGLIGGLLQGIYAGYKTVAMPQHEFVASPVRWLKAIDRFRATTSGGPNFAYEFCLDKVPRSQFESLDLSSWRIAYSGAETIRASTLLRFSNYFRDVGFSAESFHPCYGLAESTLHVTSSDIRKGPRIVDFDQASLRIGKAIPSATKGKSSDATLVSCGKPRLNQKVVIADPRTGRELSEGTLGEIWTCGPSVASGYWNRNSSTSEFGSSLVDSHVGHSFLRTGDIGFLHDGELFITGRLKDVVILRGQNHFPEDMEESISDAHESIRRGGVLVTSIESNTEETLVVGIELTRDWLRMQAGSGFMRAIVTAALNPNTSRANVTDNRVNLQVMPGCFDSMSWNSIRLRPVLRAAPTKMTLDAVRKENVSNEFAIWSFEPNSLLDEIMQALQCKHQQNPAMVPLTEIEQAIRNRLRSACRLDARLIVFVPPGGLPRTSSGKLQRRIFKEMLANNNLECVADLTVRPEPMDFIP